LRFAGRNVEHDLDPQAPDSVDDRVDLRVVLPGLELDDPRLRNAQLLRQGSLGSICAQRDTAAALCKLPRWSEPLPLRPKARIGDSSAKWASKVLPEVVIVA
jgi:hypothetical protein